MITLIVECAIIGYINHSISAWYEGIEAAELYTISHVSSLFIFLIIFFTAAPLAVYLFARIKLLDGNTKFLKLYSALGYSYVSYVPAVLLTLIGINSIKWLLILIALFNQLFCLYKQAD